MNRFYITVLLFFILFKTFGQSQVLAPYTQKINENIAIDMVPIPGGNYLIGSPITEKGRQKDEGPQLKVEITAFWIGATEITHDQFMAFRFEDKDLNPKPDAISRPTAQYIDLTWGMGKEGGFPANSMQPYTAIAYCKWLWKKTGIFYRLPTEAEWEYAANAGKKSIYGDGITPQNIKNYAWFNFNSESKYHQVSKKLPNKWGLYDMVGNVAEWTMDMYSEKYFELLKAKPQGNNYIKRDNYRAYHTAKGGGFKSSINEMRLADRQPQTENWNKRDPQIPRSKWWLTDGDSIGFRIVRPMVQLSQSEIEQFFKDNLEVGL
jgi:formylglycine-generating enzyme required for sulfatase activity